MSDDCAVQVLWRSRTAIVDRLDGRRQTLIYPGIAISRYHGGELVNEAWLPVGVDEPTDADDEALIAALRTALLWSRSAV